LSFTVSTAVSDNVFYALCIDQLQTTSEQVAGAVGARGNCSGDWLAPLELEEEGTPGPQPSVLPTRASDEGFLPMGVEDYLELLDWTGRQTVAGKTVFRNPGGRLLDAASRRG
jgi:hypothetical protein